MEPFIDPLGMVGADVSMPKQPHRFLEIALLIGLIVGTGTTYALTPLIDNMLNTSSSSTQGFTTTIFSTVISTQQSTVTVPQTSTTTSTPLASTTTTTLTSTSARTSTSTETQVTTLTTTTTRTETSTTTETTTITSSPSTAGISDVTIPLGSSTNSSLGFQPQTLLVVIGVNNTVHWQNLDNVTHSIIFLSFNVHLPSQGTPALHPGQTFSVTFRDAGTVSYFDMYYPWMRATVIVKSQ